MSVLLRMIVILVVCAGPMATGALAATQDQIDQARSRGLAWLFANQNGDGSWNGPAGLGIQATAATLEAMMNAGIKRGYSYGMAQGWLANAEALSTDSLARQSIALYRSGANVTSLVNRLTDTYRNASKAWGTYPLYNGSFPDTSLAMDAIFVSQITYADKSASLSFITGKQNTDGGWPYTKSEPGTPLSRVIPSAHNLLTLSRYKAAGTSLSDSCITNAVNWLVSRPKADGGFADDPNATSGSPYETALAYLALTEAKKITGNAAANSTQAQTVRDNALDFLVARQNTSGSWSDDPLQTALALQTLPVGALSDTDMDGIPDVVEPFLGKDPLVADSRGFARGNGQEATSLLVSPADLIKTIAVVNQSFNKTLHASGGTAPYSWTLVSGTLPDGLVLSNAGVISGAPTTLGTFNFTYKVTDSVGRNDTLAGQIIVTSIKLSVTPMADSYGTGYLSLKSPFHTFTVSNTDTKDIYVSSLALTGFDSADFVKSADGCSGRTLAALASCTVQVAFSPTTTGAKTAYLSIHTNDQATPTLNVSLNGIGALPVLSVTNTGTGTGTVTSVPPGISCGSVCERTYMTGTILSLTASPGPDSVFVWSGGCSGTGGCTVTMNSHISVTATFTCLNSPVRIVGKAGYTTLQAAYDAALDGDVIQSQALEFVENLNAWLPITVTIDGGYTCDYSANPGISYIKGAPRISAGTVKLKNIRVSY